MRKAVICCLMLYCLLSSAPLVCAVGPSLQGAPRIASPEENGVVRGIVPIVGSAVDPQFWKFELHYAPEPSPADRWTMIGAVQESQVVDGLLETWDTTVIPDGRYTLRLRVVNRTGNYSELFVRGVLVANAAPTETPVPTTTPLPTPTITPAATPTFIIPTAPLAQPTATPTLARPTRSALPDVIDVNAWRQSVCLGAQLMLVLVVALAVIFMLRRLF
jgi:hypothetical protein